MTARWELAAGFKSAVPDDTAADQFSMAADGNISTGEPAPSAAGAGGDAPGWSMPGVLNNPIAFNNYLVPTPGFGGRARASAADSGGADPAAGPLPSQLNATFSQDNPINASAAQVRQALGANNLSYTGAGITVGVLSDSFNNQGGAAADESDGALPAAAHVNVLADLPSGGEDEGRAMMEVIHDIAPGANIDFYSADIGAGTAQNGQDFANAILALARAGCTIICDDVTPPDQPWFQSGVVANAIQTVEQEGVTYLTCAGNQGFPAYQTAWNQTSLIYGGLAYDAVNFGTAQNPNPFINLTFSAGASGNIYLQWDQPWGGAVTNLEVDSWFLSGGQETHLGGPYTRAGNASYDQNDPLIAVPFNNDTSSPVTLQISIINLAGPNPGFLKFEAYDNTGGTSVTINGQNTGTVIAQHESPYAITVGAVDTGNTPALGASPAVSEPFSSSGINTEYLLSPVGANGTGGTLLATPQTLPGVGLSGVDDIATSVPDMGGGTDPNTGQVIPGDFFGTSCATPSIAAVVALLLEADPHLLPAGVTYVLEHSTAQMANTAVSGAGLVQAGAAINLALSIPPPSLGGAGNTASFQLVGGKAVVIDSGLTLTDPSSTTLATATISIGSASLFAGDVLAATTAGTAITAAYNAPTGMLTLSGTDTLANYQTVLRSVTYGSTSSNPANSEADISRTISFTASDAGQISTTVSSTVLLSLPPPAKSPVVLNDFGWAQGWGSPDNPRIMADVDGNGSTDYVGFGASSVFIGYGGTFNNGQGVGPGFTSALPAVQDFGTSEGYTANVQRGVAATGAGVGDTIYGQGFVGVYWYAATASTPLTDLSGKTVKELQYQTSPNLYANFGSQEGWTPDNGFQILKAATSDAYASILGFGSAGIVVGPQAFAPNATAAAAYVIPLAAGNSSGWDQQVDIRTFTDAGGNTIDLNHDGIADFVGMGPQGLVYAMGNKSGPGGAYQLGQLQTAHINGGNTDLGEAQGWNDATTLRFIIGDPKTGFDDILAFGAAGVYVAMGQDPAAHGGEPFGQLYLAMPDFGSNQGWSVAQTPRIVGDVNGDGVPDIVGFGANATFAALGSRDASGNLHFALDQSQTIGDFGYNEAWSGTNPQTIRALGDVAGSGHSDLILSGAFNTQVWQFG